MAKLQFRLEPCRFVHVLTYKRFDRALVQPLQSLAPTRISTNEYEIPPHPQVDLNAAGWRRKELALHKSFLSSATLPASKTFLSLCDQSRGACRVICLSGDGDGGIGGKKNFRRRMEWNRSSLSSRALSLSPFPHLRFLHLSESDWEKSVS